MAAAAASVAAPAPPASAPRAAARLTPTELRWLRGAAPVVAQARAEGMPLDIVVQPQPTPDLPPLALAFVDGRCKLVLSMRGNPQAQQTLDRIEPDLLDPVLELMTAHELGHCRRYLDGAWYGLPAGFTAGSLDGGPAIADGGVRTAWAAMQAARREEAYGDLVGLAWVERHRPGLYPRLHAWLHAERSSDRVPGSPHDTLAWVALAAERAALAGGSIYAAAAALWTRGLRADAEVVARVD